MAWSKSSVGKMFGLKNTPHVATETIGVKVKVKYYIYRTNKINQSRKII